MPNPITTTPNPPYDANANDVLLQASRGREHGKMPASVHSVDSNQFIYLCTTCVIAIVLINIPDKSPHKPS